ncbi:MAG: carbohydrate-binding protein, partial [Clostridia bacterium]|nr:carbohydrate-binding protein [Clostridia bacterium]
GKICDVCAIQINFADQDIENTHGRGHGFSYRYLVEISENGTAWSPCLDNRENDNDLSHVYFQLDSQTQFRYIRITNHGAVPAGGKFSISGLRLFGNGGSRPPEAPPVFRAVRCTDPRNMEVSWENVPGAEGYNIRFGIRPDALYTHWQVIGDTSANLGSLTTGVTYYVTVDAYNDSGIAYGTNVISV